MRPQKSFVQAVKPQPVTAEDQKRGRKLVRTCTPLLVPFECDSGTVLQ